MWNLLENARQSGTLVRLKREIIDTNSMFGFVGALSTDFLALNVVDENSRFDGVRVFETEHVSFLEWDTAALKNRARILEESPSSPLALGELDLTSWESVVRSATTLHSVLTFHRDLHDSRSCYLGQNVQIEGDCLRADQIDTDGNQQGHFALLLSDLTHIDFGDAYGESMRLMARNSAEPQLPDT